MVGLYIYFSLGSFFWITALIIFLRAKEKAFYFLSAHLIIMGVAIITRTFQFNGLMFSYPHFFGLLDPLQFLYGPFYYFFLIGLFEQKKGISKYKFLHFVPFFFTLVDLLPFYVLSAAQKKELILSDAPLSYLGVQKVYYEYLKAASYVIYFIWALRYYLRYIYFTKISIDRNALLIHYWLRSDLLLKAIAIVAVIYVNIYSTSASFTYGYYVFSLNFLLSGILVYLNPSLLNGFTVAHQYRHQQYSFSFFLFTKKLFFRLFKINHHANHSELASYLFQIRKVHLDPEFDASDLAERLNISLEKLTEYFSSTYHCDIDEYICFKRLEFLYDSYSEISFNGIITEAIFKSGFDSITSFQYALIKFSDFKHKNSFSISPGFTDKLKKDLEVTFSKNV